MARKEINVFSVSFLDLLSGALAAVIILYIIVPKMSQEQQQAIEQLEELQQQIQQMDSLMARLENTVPSALYEQIQHRLNAMQNAIDQLTEEVQRLQQQLARSESENENLRQQLEQARRELEAAREEAQRNRNVSDGKIFGMDAELGIVCVWPENVDVDLYVEDLSNNNVCYYGNKVTLFGNLMEDVTSRASADDDRYELFYQKRIIPGQYRVYVNIYSNSHAPATVEGYVVLFPGRPSQKKIPYGPIYLNSVGQNAAVGVLTVTSTGISLSR